MDRKYIKNGQLVHHVEKEAYGLGIIENVTKADRGDEKELMYDIKYLVGGKIYEGICEHSGMTSSFLEPITKEDARNKLLSREYDLDVEIGKTNQDRIAVVMGKASLNAL